MSPLRSDRLVHEQKGKVELSLRLIKHRAMKTYGSGG
jgi:hypothetical protein